MMIRNRSGFTLIDTLVAIGLLGVITLGAFNMLVFINSNRIKNESKIDTLIGQTIGDRYLYISFKNAAPSFNNILSPLNVDDNGQNFFDLNTQYPVLARPVAARTRMITLTPNGKNEFFVLSAKTRSGPPRYIDPVKLYQTSPSSIGTDGTLNYVGPDNGGYFTSLNSTQIFSTSASPPASGILTDKFFKDGNILYFYANASARSPSLPASGFYQSYGFFGKVNGQSINLETFGGKIQTLHPNGSPVVSLDDYLRGLPPGNGSIPIVSARPVELYRYFFRISQSNAKKTKYALYYQVWNGTAFAGDQLIVDNVTSVVLKRPSVADASVSFSIKLGDN